MVTEVGLQRDLEEYIKKYADYLWTCTNGSAVRYIHINQCLVNMVRCT